MPRTASRATLELITSEALGALFDKAFAQWHGFEVGTGSRRAPRISTRGRKPLLVVSYRHEGRVVKVNRRARLADMSADGLGLALSRAIPVDAVVRFAFNDDGTRGYGEATVVHHSRRGTTHRIGLVFCEAAQSLGRESRFSEGEEDAVASRRASRGSGLGGLMAFWRILSAAGRRRVEVVHAIDGQSACLVVEAKLFRYRATLCVDGRKVCSFGGALHDRLGNVLGRPVSPTVVELEGGGFLGVATVESNHVVRATLEPSRKNSTEASGRGVCGVLVASAC